MHRVPCPHCGKHNDFRKLTASARNTGWGGDMLETGTVVDCDTCGKKAEIAKVQSVRIVTLRQYNK